MVLDLHGFVQQVEEKTFWAHVIDLTKEDRPEYSVELAKVQIEPAEREYIQPGAYFFWWICDDGSYCISFSKEVWTKEELDQAKRKATELSKVLGWNNEENQESTL